MPAFKLKGVTFCGKGIVVEIETSMYHGDKYHFSVESNVSTDY